MELYYIIAITDHDRGEAMGSLYHAAGLHLILSMPAPGTATSEHLMSSCSKFMFGAPPALRSSWR